MTGACDRANKRGIALWKRHDVHASRFNILANVRHSFGKGILILLKSNHSVTILCLPWNFRISTGLLASSLLSLLLMLRQERAPSPRSSINLLSRQVHRQPCHSRLCADGCCSGRKCYWPFPDQFGTTSVKQILRNYVESKFWVSEAVTQSASRNSNLQIENLSFWGSGPICKLKFQSASWNFQSLMQRTNLWVLTTSSAIDRSRRVPYRFQNGRSLDAMR